MDNHDENELINHLFKDDKSLSKQEFIDRVMGTECSWILDLHQIRHKLNKIALKYQKTLESDGSFKDNQMRNAKSLSFNFYDMTASIPLS